MSLNEQLIEDIELQFLSSDGILKIVRRMSIEELRDVLSKINKVLDDKKKMLEHREILEAMQLYNKVDINPTLSLELKEKQIYVALFIKGYPYYIVYIDGIDMDNNNPRINGLLMVKGMVFSDEYTETVFDEHIKFQSWNHHLNYYWYQIIDQDYIEKAKKFDLK